MVLKGEKKVTLISPAYTKELYTAGKLVKVHTNGRMNYEGQITHADGRDLKADRAFEASVALKEAAATLNVTPNKRMIGTGRSREPKTAPLA